MKIASYRKSLSSLISPGAGFRITTSLQTAAKSSPSIHLKPFSIRRPAVTPAPETSVPVKVPSYRCFTPQLGLLDCSTISSGLSRRAISRHFAAPARNSLSTLRPSLAVTMPSLISEGTRGVGRPPICSGQTVITSLPAISRRIFSLRLLPPLYLQFSPARQALTMIFIPPSASPILSSDFHDKQAKPASIRKYHIVYQKYNKKHPDMYSPDENGEMKNDGRNLTSDPRTHK